jgi:autotransporter translocation and assembly factor TamB
VSRILGRSIVVVIAVAVVLFVFRAPLERTLVASIVSAALGAHTTIGAGEFGREGAEFSQFHIERSGLPFFDAERIRIAYAPGELFRGNEHRFGLRSIELVRPHFWLARRPDGSFNLPHRAASGNTGGGAPAPQPGAPLAFDARIEGGVLTLLDRSLRTRVPQDVELAGIDGTLVYAERGASRYAFHAQLASGAKPSPVSLRGFIDFERGLALHRLTSSNVALPALLNFAIDSPVMHVRTGSARELEVRAYALDIHPDADFSYHLAGSAEVRDAILDFSFLKAPMREVRGRIDLFDDGIASPRLDAILAGIPVRASGGLVHWERLALRLGIEGDGTLAELRRLFAFSRDRPIEGPVHAGVLVEGPLEAPLVLAQLRSAHAAYGALPLDDLRAAVAYSDSSAVLGPVAARYGPLDLRLNGVFDIGEHLATRLALTAGGPAARIPYAAQLVPASTVTTLALLTGTDAAFELRGAVSGDGPGERLDGLYHVDPKGHGAIGPIAIERGGGSLEGAFLLRREENESLFWADARNLALAPVAAPPSLPGLSLPEIPAALGGRIDARVAGIGHPSDFRIGGTASSRSLRSQGFDLADIAVRFGGSPQNLSVSNVRAAGPWGSFSGGGGYAGGRLALRGLYDGSFRQLAGLTGELGASGPVRGPVSVLIGGDRTVVQTTGALTPGANVRGVPLSRLEGTIAIGSGGLDVYSARGSVAGGSVTANGRLALDGSAGEGLAVTASGLDAAQLRGTGLPLDRGRIAAVGTVGAARAAPFADASVMLGGGGYGALDLSGHSDVRLEGGNLTLAGGSALVDGTLSRFDGRLSGLGAAPRYDLALSIRGAELGPLVRRSYPQRRDVGGTVDADVHVGGRGGSPTVAGAVRVPEGTANGQAFRDGAARVSYDGRTLDARAGTVTVGTTLVGFTGAGRNLQNLSMRVTAPSADLADFNDLFDEGDVLGGRGHAVLAFSRARGAVQTFADAAISDLRYRRFALGDTRVVWASSGRRVDGVVGFSGPAGTLDASGALTLPQRSRLMKVLERSEYSLSGAVRGLDLGVWLPALGYDVPLTGRVDANATVSGRYPALAFSSDATLLGGTIGKLPVDRLAVSATSTLARTTITSAVLEVPTLSVTGDGSLGFGETDLLDLHVHATSPDIGASLARLAERRLPVTGALEADARIRGSRLHPTLAGGFEVSNATARGVAVPLVVGSLESNGRELRLNDAEIDFSKGSLLLAGSLPFTIAPFSIGPPKAPITLEAAAKGVDLGDFLPLLPPGSELAGLLDGRIALGGTAGSSRLIGELALGGGRIVTPFERAPLTNVAGHVSLAGNDVRLGALHADAGGGALDASGTISIPDLSRFEDASSYAFAATAKHAQLDLPEYGHGVLDASVNLSHLPHTTPTLAGEATLSEAVVPFSALYKPSAADTTSPLTASVGPAAPAVRDLAFDMQLRAANNVRVRSGNLDLGARGAVALSGTLAAPRLKGRFDSTGGTITYFNTAFRLVDGFVTFAPSDGIIPALNARATTHVINPDPAARDYGGGADITMNVSGLVTSPTITFDSVPQYDQQQILGLLLRAPTIGANLFSTTGRLQTPLDPTQQQTVAKGATSADVMVAQQAFEVLNAQFVRNLLSPIETAFGNAIGLSSLNVTLGYGGEVGVIARRGIGKYISAVYGSGFFYPYRQTLGIEYHRSVATVAQLTFFQTLATSDYLVQSASLAGTDVRGNLLPATGSKGYSFSLQHLFW